MTMTLEVRDGRFAYPGEKPVLDGVNFSFSGRGILSILGPNGAGKTTLLRALLGLAPFSSGSVRWCGREWRDWKPREFWTRVGYVPQAKVPQFAAMTISELVALGRSSRLSPFALPGAADWEAVDRALETVGIAHLGARLCSAVSGGQLQLALIARALAAEPELLVLDEPESNLDFRNQRIVVDTLAKLARDGLGAVINTHFPAHALELSNEVLLVPRGEPPLCGPIERVMTEENLTRAFGIRIRMGEAVFPEKTVPVVAAVGRSEDALSIDEQKNCNKLPNEYS